MSTSPAPLKAAGNTTVNGFQLGDLSWDGAVLDLDHAPKIAHVGYTSLTRRGPDPIHVGSRKRPPATGGGYPSPSGRSVIPGALDQPTFFDGMFRHQLSHVPDPDPRAQRRATERSMMCSLR